MSDPPENPKFDRKSGSRNTPELPPAESDFWDLEEESEPSAAPITPEPRSPRPSDSKDAAAPDDGPKSKGDKKIEPEEANRAKSSRKSPQEDEIQPQTLVEAASDLTGRFSKSEKLSILAVGAGLLIVAIWALNLFFSTIHTESPDAEVKFPVTGEHTTIKSVNTYWREPKPDSDRGVRKEASLIPAAKITLGPESTAGALRILFKDDGDRIVGDAITVSIKDGKFTNGNTEVEVYATEGFTDEGDHAAYLTEQIGTWYMIVKEGPDRNSAGNAFSDLIRIPISNSRY